MATPKVQVSALLCELDRATLSPFWGRPGWTLRAGHPLPDGTRLVPTMWPRLPGPAVMGEGVSLTSRSVPLFAGMASPCPLSPPLSWATLAVSVT